MIEASESAISQNAKGDIIPDYKARASVVKDLMEMSGLKAKKNADIQINVMQAIY